MPVTRGACGWICGLVVAAAACTTAGPPQEHFDIATTTSVVNSGLMLHLADAYQQDTGIEVRVHAAGSGRALEMLAGGTVDLIISHAPEAEARALRAHADWTYRKIATNRFWLVGPEADPASINAAANVMDAATRIAEAKAPFVSRGDESGTHERERSLWNAAKVTTDPAWLIISGTGMAATLRMADARGAYTLTDDATFLQLQHQLALKPLLTNDPALVNAYAVIFKKGSVAAARLAEWLTNEPGASAIAAYRIGETAPFHPWPAGCPSSTPDALPCDAAGRR